MVTKPKFEEEFPRQASNFWGGLLVSSKFLVLHPAELKSASYSFPPVDSSSVLLNNTE